MRRHFSLIAAAAAAAAAIASATFSTNAQASDEYPPVIAEVVGAKEAPPCTICHATLSGGTGTVVQPFGIKMRKRGLVKSDVESLKAALAAIQVERSDIDADGIPDFDELKAGTNPNGTVSSDVAAIEYGCARMSPSAPTSTPVIVLTALAATALIRRRKRRPL